MPLNLDNARTRLPGKIMQDTCKITRRPADTGRYKKGELNKLTGKLTKASPITVYEGACFISPSGLVSRSRMEDVGGLETSQLGYDTALPYSAPEILPGDEVEVLTSKYDPLMVGEKFIAKSMDLSTATVMRRFRMEGMETSRG